VDTHLSVPHLPSDLLFSSNSVQSYAFRIENLRMKCVEIIFVSSVAYAWCVIIFYFFLQNVLWQDAMKSCDG
jgi:hypothetical protein